MPRDEKGNFVPKLWEAPPLSQSIREQRRRNQTIRNGGPAVVSVFIEQGVQRMKESGDLDKIANAMGLTDESTKT